MTLRSSRRSRLLIQVLLLLISLSPLAGCGKKGPIRPLLRAEPAAPGRPEARQIGKEVVLLADLPTTNLDGSPLTDLSELRLYRRETADGVCRECDEPTELWRTIDLLTDPPRGGRIVIRDTEVRPGYGYRYRMIPVTERGLSGAAVSLSRELYLPLQAPQKLSGVGYDRMVRLEWQEDPDLAPGWSSSGCQVDRATSEESNFLPLTSEPVQGGRFNDIGPVNGIRYLYRVRCLAAQREITIESPPSATIEVTPHPE